MSEQSVSVSSQPKTAADFVRRGWENRTAGKAEEAERDFRKAISLDGSAVEAYYGLGLMLKNQQRKKEALENFNKVLELIETILDDRARAEMLRRLSRGNINMIQKGEWGLEEEIWGQEQSQDEANTKP